MGSDASSFTPEATHSNLVTPVSLSMSSSLATNQLSFNQLVSLTNSNYTVNSESNNTNTNKQIDIMQMLTKAQNQYNQSNNNSGGGVKTILEPPTSHSTPGSLSTHSLVGTQEPTTGGEPKPIAQWPHDLFLNSNQFIKKPEPLRRATNGVLDNGQQQQQSNTSLNTSSSISGISGGITCSPPSSTSSSVASSSSSSTTSSSSSATSNINSQKQSNNALLNLLMSSTSSNMVAAAAPSASTCLDNPKIESSMFNTNRYVLWS